jgi:peptide/nickel transport system ATP-binding protein
MTIRTNLLHIDNLSVEFTTDEGVVNAVNGIHLKIVKGQTMGLVGESGSGKSVTALAVMRLLAERHSRITSGSIWFDHPSQGRINLLQISQREMQLIRGNYISMVFQEPMSSLNPVHRCGRQVAEVLRQHTRISRMEAKRRVLSLFEEVRLPDPPRVFDAWPHQLSGGQRQRVMIAMAIACKPSLMIADEPTTALDVTVQKEILELLKQIQNDHGMAILFISHDLGVVADIADQTAVMLRGEVVESGDVATILSVPVHPYTKALIACRPSLIKRPERLAVIDDFLQNAGPEIRDIDPITRQKHHTKMYNDPPVLEVTDLATSFVTSRTIFGKVKSVYTAVNHISFDVYQGETLGLVGESGCGKTTLGRSLIRLVEADGGKIFYKGTDIRSLNRKEMRSMRRKFQIIFQDPYASLTPGMMVGSAIMEPMHVHGILASDKQRKARVFDLLERVNLEEKHFYRYPHEFSGGQRQRICIARALALNPEFIICDEAVSALDVSVQAQVLNLLNEMKEEFRLTYIFISHDLSVVKYMSDRILVMKSGNMTELSEADKMYKNPASEYTRKLLEAIPGTTYFASSPQ